MSDHIKLRKAPGIWVIRTGDAVIGESRNAVELTEGSYGPVIYFPQSDVAMMFLEPSARTSHCPHKGDAKYFSIVTPSATLKDSVWCYDTPPPELAAIAGHLAFYTDRVTVENI